MPATPIFRDLARRPVERADRSQLRRSEPSRNPVFLVPVNYSPSSQAAVRLALDLASSAAAKIVFLRVISPKSWRVADNHGSIAREDRRLRAFVEALQTEASTDSDYELAIALDRVPHRKIAETAESCGAALIVMGARRDGIRQRIFGGVAERTRRAARCPVISINAPYGTRLRP